MPETTAGRGLPGWVLRTVLVLLALVFLVLQYRLWVGEGSLAELVTLGNKVERQQQANAQLQERNAKLSGQVDALKNGLGEIEARAREDLGMIKDDETFFMVVDDNGEQETGP